jgi:hypothetical protein
MNLLQIHRLPSRIKMKTNAAKSNQIGIRLALSGTTIACHRNGEFPGPTYPPMDEAGHLPAKEWWL